MNRSPPRVEEESFAETMFVAAIEATSSIRGENVTNEVVILDVFRCWFFRWRRFKITRPIRNDKRKAIYTCMSTVYLYTSRVTRRWSRNNVTLWHRTRRQRIENRKNHAKNDLRCPSFSSLDEGQKGADLWLLVVVCLPILDRIATSIHF